MVAALGWVGTVIIVRQLSEAEWGRFSFIVSLLGIIGFIADLKLSRIVLRDVIGADVRRGAAGSSAPTSGCGS